MRDSQQITLSPNVSGGETKFAAGQLPSLFHPIRAFCECLSSHVICRCMPSLPASRVNAAGNIEVVAAAICFVCLFRVHLCQQPSAHLVILRFVWFGHFLSFVLPSLSDFRAFFHSDFIHLAMFMPFMCFFSSQKKALQLFPVLWPERRVNISPTCVADSQSVPVHVSWKISMWQTNGEDSGQTSSVFKKNKKKNKKKPVHLQCCALPTQSIGIWHSGNEGSTMAFPSSLFPSPRWAFINWSTFPLQSADSKLQALLPLPNGSGSEQSWVLLRVFIPPETQTLPSSRARQLSRLSGGSVSLLR